MTQQARWYVFTNALPRIPIGNPDGYTTVTKAYNVGVAYSRSHPEADGYRSIMLTKEQLVNNYYEIMTRAVGTTL